MADSMKNDRRVNSLEERMFFAKFNFLLLGPEYKSFLEEYNNLILHKVTNFDDLVREVEEKEKRMGKAMIMETPLVNFLLQQALEKV